MAPYKKRFVVVTFQSFAGIFGDVFGVGRIIARNVDNRFVKPGRIAVHPRIFEGG